MNIESDLKEMEQEDISEKVERLKYHYYEEGWSLDLSMFKAGFGKVWHKTYVAEHPEIIKIREHNQERYKKKRLGFVR